ncbi:unnamed protein product [Allacma fusca]|uniref:Uncharacterized protein n=1 Tax=Allacma fusca TaxID=39272 RepID=A0A8J2LBR0_9HEXA|nr:unnamed protein product [Allacma fusca]
MINNVKLQPPPHLKHTLHFVTWNFIRSHRINQFLIAGVRNCGEPDQFTDDYEDPGRSNTIDNLPYGRAEESG